MELQKVSTDLNRFGMPRSYHRKLSWPSGSSIDVPLTTDTQLVPLHKKFPVSRSRSKVQFSKSKLGVAVSCRKPPLNCYVTFTSPQCLSGKLAYNALHDPHLKHYFSKKHMLKRLRENGEINEQNDVLCSLKEFNDYRNGVYNALMCPEKMRIRNQMKIDKKLIAHAEYIANKEMRLKRLAKVGRRSVQSIPSTDNKSLVLSSYIAHNDSRSNLNGSQQALPPITGSYNQMHGAFPSAPYATDFHAVFAETADRIRYAIFTTIISTMPNGAFNP